MAAQVIEISPGLDIEPLTDVALKSTDVQAGILIVERQFGYLEIHSRSTAAVQSASAAVLDALGAAPQDAVAPQILASELISRIDRQHAFLINRNKIGSMALPGESLFVLEMQPASYAILATNEAEKAARIKVVDYRMIGATGRVYLTGVEADVRAAADAAVAGTGRARMSTGDEDLLRNVTREVLAELLPGPARGRARHPGSGRQRERASTPSARRARASPSYPRCPLRPSPRFIAPPAGARRHLTRPRSRARLRRRCPTASCSSPSPFGATRTWTRLSARSPAAWRTRSEREAILSGKVRFQLARGVRREPRRRRR